MKFSKDVKFGLKAALVSAVVVPAMGIVAHLAPTDMFPMNDASLSHRFECAYGVNPNPEHKTYVMYDYKENNTYSYVEDKKTGQMKYWDTENQCVYEDSWIEADMPYDKICLEKKYAASPFITYPLHILIAGGVYAGLRRRDRYNELLARRQKAR